VRDDFYLVCADAEVAAQARARLDKAPLLEGAKVVCLGAKGDVQGVLYGEEERDTVRRWLAEHGAVAAIVRPDGFAWGGVRSAADLDGAIGELAQALALENGASVAVAA
jgi:3-(3-hydroxy-phenyl)propionate hydroxylase